MNKVGRHFPLEFKIEAVKLVTEQGYIQSPDAIDTFSLSRIIPLNDHPIYRDGRRFAVYRWMVTAEVDISRKNVVCKTKEKSQDGMSLPKVSTALDEKSDCNQPMKLS